MRWPSVMLSLCAVLAAGTALAGTIEELDLDSGREHTLLENPLYEADAAFRLEFARFGHAFDYSRPLVDKLGSTGTRDKLAPSIDPGALFSDELRRQAREMGLPVGGDGWTVAGTVEDIVVENRAIVFGPLLFFGHVRATFEVTSPDGQMTTVRYRFHPTTARFNAGFGTKDENTEAVAQVLILSAQDAVARLNHELFSQPADARVAQKLAAVQGGGSKDPEKDIRWLGLSGAPEAVAPLLAVARGGNHESERVAAVEALALLGATDAAPELAQRYSGEAEDVRCAILGAVAELDEAAGLSLAGSQGVRDDNKACRFLAQRIVGEAR